MQEAKGFLLLLSLTGTLRHFVQNRCRSFLVGGLYSALASVFHSVLQS